MNFLFLQGLSSPFFSRLAEELDREDHVIHKVFFCGGDLLFWRWKRNFHHHFYRGKAAGLKAYYAALLARHAIDAVVLFGDCRPVHLPALALCRECGIPVFVFEEGYLRPFWVTMDYGGANADTSLPRDPEFYREMPQESGLPPEDVSGGFGMRVLMDVLCHAANLILHPVFFHYRTHRPHLAGVEYAGFIVRYTRNRWRRFRYAKRLRALLESGDPFYFLPMQLDADYQIRRNSPLRSMEQVIDHVAASFAAHAPAGSRLAVKLHPLDNGLTDYEPVCRAIARRHGLQERLIFFEGGTTPDILRRCEGVVTVNSTVGLSALHHNLKVKVLGRAFYDMAALTWQGTLDDLWVADFCPDKVLFASFRQALIDRTQINGSFFTRRGQILGARLAAARMLEELAFQENNKSSVVRNFCAAVS